MRSPAIVLQLIPHNDTTLVTTLYTATHGTVSFVLRRPRNGKSGKSGKSGVSLPLFQPLTLLQVEWEHRDNISLQRMQNAHLRHPYSTLTSQPRKAATASMLTEMLAPVLRDDRQGELFEFIEQSLLWLDAAPQQRADNFALVFILRLIAHAGVAPDTTQYRPGKVFDLLNGEWLDTPPPAHRYYLLPNDARHIPLFMRLRLHNMHLVRLDAAQYNRALRVVSTYARLHVTNFPQLKSIDLVCSLRRDIK